MKRNETKNGNLWTKNVLITFEERAHKIKQNRSKKKNGAQETDKNYRREIKSIQ